MYDRGLFRPLQNKRLTRYTTSRHNELIPAGRDSVRLEVVLLGDTTVAEQLLPAVLRYCVPSFWTSSVYSRALMYH